MYHYVRPIQHQTYISPISPKVVTDSKAEVLTQTKGTLNEENLNELVEQDIVRPHYAKIFDNRT